MKTLLLAVLLFVTAFSAQAQLKIVNNTPCPMRVTPACFDPATCTGGPCGAMVVVPAFGSVPMPICACPMPSVQGFIVCYGPGTMCGNICTTVGNAAASCPGWPVPGVLAACPACGTVARTLNYDPAGNLVIF